MEASVVEITELGAQDPARLGRQQGSIQPLVTRPDHTAILLSLFIALNHASTLSGLRTSLGLVAMAQTTFSPSYTNLMFLHAL